MHRTGKARCMAISTAPRLIPLIGGLGTHPAQIPDQGNAMHRSMLLFLAALGRRPRDGAQGAGALCARGPRVRARENEQIMERNALVERPSGII